MQHVFLFFSLCSFVNYTGYLRVDEGSEEQSSECVVHLYLFSLFSQKRLVLAQSSAIFVTHSFTHFFLPHCNSLK